MGNPFHFNAVSEFEWYNANCEAQVRFLCSQKLCSGSQSEQVPSSSSSVLIFLTVVGALFVLLLIVVAVVFVLRRRKPQRVVKTDTNDVYGVYYAGDERVDESRVEFVDN